MGKKYSIVIITYQSRNLIKNTLSALNSLNYDKEDYEVVLVDDGSNDGTYEYISSIKKDYDFSYIFLERCDLSCRSRARNLGWQAAKGEIIAFLDADVIVKDNYLSELDRYYSAEKDLLLIGTRLMLPSDINYEKVDVESLQNKYSFNRQKNDVMEFRHHVFGTYSYNLFALPHPWIWVYGCNMVVPRIWVEAIQGFDDAFLGWGREDTDFAIRLFFKGIKIMINSKLEVLHQYHNMVSGNSEENIESTRFFLDKHIRYFKDSYDKAFDCFTMKSLDFLYDSLERKNVSKRIFEFSSKYDLDKLKNDISVLADIDNIEIIILDYVEDTDLDVWIQLLGKRNSTPKYYPISRLLGFE